MPSFEAVQELDRYLGDPQNPTSKITWAKAVELDEREEFPQESIHALNAWGLGRYFVPSEYGGALTSYPEMLNLIRSVSQRDLTTAIGRFKTLLGSLPIWIARKSVQANELSSALIRNADVSLALTEAEHGSDLLASELNVINSAKGYLLTGKKWLINNATRSQFLCVLGRDHGKSGPLSLSLLLVDKETLAPESWKTISKIKTLGVRGADISGIVFEQARLDSSSLIGRAGFGLDTVMRTFQVSRPLCAGLSLGAGDSALRMALNFVRNRRLYEKTVWDIDVVQDTLAKTFIDLQIAEIVALTTCKGLHALPECMSLWSSIAKYLVPTLVNGVIENTARIIGARYYLRESFEGGYFQKNARDHALVSLFDGSTQVNLSAISAQLPMATDGTSEVDLRLKLIGSDESGFLPVDYKALRFRIPGSDPMLMPLKNDPLWQPWINKLKSIVKESEDPQSASRFMAAQLYCYLFAVGACRLTSTKYQDLIEERLLSHIEGPWSATSRHPNQAALGDELFHRSVSNLSFGI